MTWGGPFARCLIPGLLPSGTVPAFLLLVHTVDTDCKLPPVVKHCGLWTKKHKLCLFNTSFHLNPSRCLWLTDLVKISRQLLEFKYNSLLFPALLLLFRQQAGEDAIVAVASEVMTPKRF